MIIQPTPELMDAMKTARKTLKLQQRQVDLKCGWKAPHYSFFERGKKGFPRDMVEKMAAALQIELCFDNTEEVTND